MYSYGPPTYGRAKAGRPARAYIQQLCEDTGCSPEDLPEAMNDREKWRERVRDIRATSTTWWWWWWWCVYIKIFGVVSFSCIWLFIFCRRFFWIRLIFKQIYFTHWWECNKTKNFCYIITEGFFILSFFVLYILPFGLVRLRTFQLSAQMSQ